MSASKKALMHAHTAYMVTQFNIDNIKILQDLGYAVDVACCWQDDDSAVSPEALAARRKKLDDLGCRVIETSSLRKIFHFGELSKAYKLLKTEVEKNKYEIVHTQSPIGGVVCRLACRRARKLYGTKVIYAAHGFHFFKGASLINTIIFKNVEKWCSKYTDLLITINKEDYANAQKMKAKQVAYVPGAGVDTHKFVASEGARQKIRKELGIDDETIIILSVGELIPRKNHTEVLRALKMMKDNGTLLAEGSDERVQPKYKIKYLIAGRGKIQAELEENIARLGLSDYVQMLGFRSDVADIFAASDIYVFPSHQEGLPVALMEAMSVGMPVVCSKIRGNTDLIEEGIGGYFFDSHDAATLVTALNKALSDNLTKREQMGQANIEVMKQFDKETVNKVMRELYSKL
ncbi:Glycosyltransferase involved in cell wall bisynthesis [Pseudobutyrivibrio sp. ACV-2]|uniref:glycosyltransferase family 4 protein n=1 Tax=Pseudobutyrivibrio sp. ACV-2 TaxID=1520801 RepID=UPI000896EA85|nr:glycosyltransferase family 4 protein [Pseudobutyrivibrio sp. ACV-2]SEA51172.1 Glycosyltransferase involved in cell wall bisynthesis [Pseudobutyrivibrio sp. ACV-2]